MRYELSYLKTNNHLATILKPRDSDEAKFMAASLPKGSDIVLMRLDDDGRATSCFLWDCRGSFVAIWVADNEKIPL